jgi:hypothetical protein
VEKNKMEEEEGKREKNLDQPQSVGVTRHLSPPLLPKFLPQS